MTKFGTEFDSKLADIIKRICHDGANYNPVNTKARVKKIKRLIFEELYGAPTHERLSEAMGKVGEELPF
jgi:hypothetical protein